MEHHFATVGPAFFRVMRTPIVRGREFSALDSEGGSPVVVVNEVFARRFWPGQEPLGKWVAIGGYRRGVPAEAKRWTVVGVARDAKYNSLGEDPTPFLFFPQRQLYRAAMTLLVRTTGNPAAMRAPAEEIVKSLDPDLPLYSITTLAQYIGTSLVPIRMAAGTLGATAALALILAAGGIYGVVAYSVSRRIREIGLRMALGAHKATILRMVLGRGMAMTAIGMAFGLAAAAGMTRFASFLLFAISPLDPITFLAIPSLLGLVALAASLVPALHATRVVPGEALRYE